MSNFMKFDGEYRGIRINGKSPIAGWFRMEHTIYKWMITGGYPYFRKPP